MQEDLNWNLLRTFCVIAEEKSITRASLRLQISQPSVSSALQKLENQLGCQLVFRDSRHFELTLRGNKVYLEAKAMFQGAERIGQIVDEDLVEERGEIRFQIISNLASPLIDELMRLFHQRYPSVIFNVEVRNSSEIVQNIQQRNIGLGFCLLNRPILNLESLLLFREEFKIFCGTEHPFFGRESVTERELQLESFIAFTCANDGMGLEPMAVLRESTSLGNRITGTSSNLQEIKRMIVAGMGIGILPPNAIKYDIEAGVLWPLEISGHPIGADVYLVHTSFNDLSSAEQKFIQTTEELLPIYQR